MLYRKISVDDGIDRVRSLLRSDGSFGIPTIMFNPKCRGTIAEMGGGPSPLPGRASWSYKLAKDGSILGDVPGDDNNDGCKALAYGLIEMLGYVDNDKVVTGPVMWTEPRGPLWTDWTPVDKEAEASTQLLRSGGATYLCRTKIPHSDYTSAVGCKGH